MNKTMKSILKKLIVPAFLVTLGAGALTMEKEIKASAAEAEVSAYALAYKEYTIENYVSGMVVKDPLGNTVTTENGSFIPLKVGDYTIRDGGKITILRVFATNPKTNYNYEFLYEEEYKTGEVITLPKVTVSSEIKNNIACDIYVEYNDQIIDNFKATEKSYQPMKAGSYAFVYTYEDIFGYISTSTNYFEVVDAPVIGYYAPEEFSLGKEVSVDKIYAYNGVDKVEADLEVLSPSSKRIDISSGSFVASEIGNYTYNVSVSIGGQTLTKSYQIPCDVYAHDLFENTAMANKPVSEFALPEICLEEGTGVLLQATATGGLYTYTSVIDLNQISRNKNLLSFFPYVTDDIGYVEDLQIILTDIHDKDNSVGIQFKCSPFHDDLTYVSAFHGVRHYAFDNENWVLTGVNGPVKIGDQYFFAGIMRNHYSMQMKGKNGLEIYSFTMDYPNRQMVLDLTSEGEGRYTLMDFDNPIWCGGADYVWNGFTTGEVYMTISFGTTVGNGASIIVTEIAGQSLSSKKVNDTVPPSLVLNIDNEYKTAMPYGVVGTPYAIPEARANDAISGKVDVEVVLKRDGVKVEYNGGKYIPEQAGRYEVTYTAKDLKGNVAKETLTFEVFASQPQITVETAAYQAPVPGKYFLVPEIIIRGASGKSTIVTEIVYNGKTVAPDARGKIFIDKVGEIKLNVEATDWLGQKVSDVVSIPVTTDEMVISVERIGSVQKGRTIAFANATVFDFNGKGNNSVEQTIFVNGKEINGNTYTVQNTDTALNIRYVVECAGKTAEESYTISVFEGLDDIFVTDGQFNVRGAHNDEMHFTFEQDGYFELVNPVSHNSLRLSFATPVYAFESMDMYLTDANNPDISVFIRFTEYSRTQVRMQLNGKGDYYLLNGSLSANVVFSFFYEPERKVFKRPVDEKVIFNVDECINGDVFNGFESGAVRLKVKVNGVQGSSTIRLGGVSNESFVTYLLTGKDSVKPVVSLPQDKEVRPFGYGETYVIEPTKAYDVIQGAFDVKVSVTAPDGSVLLDGQVLKESYSFTVDQYGEYYIDYETFENTYTVKGSAMLTLQVKDKVLPQITVSGTVISQAKLGDVYKFIGGSATDNVDSAVAVKIIIYDPQYRNKVVKAGEEYRFTYTGAYKLVYLATDAAGNTARQIYIIEVQ